MKFFCRRKTFYCILHVIQQPCWTHRAQTVAVMLLLSVYATNDGGVMVTSNLGKTAEQNIQVHHNTVKHQQQIRLWPAQVSIITMVTTKARCMKNIWLIHSESLFPSPRKGKSILCRWPKVLHFCFKMQNEQGILSLVDWEVGIINQKFLGAHAGSLSEILVACRQIVGTC